MPEETESLKPSHLVVVDDMPNGWKVEAWYEAEDQADEAANILKEKHAALQTQFKVIDGIRVTESCAFHGKNIAVFYVGAECPLCNALETRTISESDRKLLKAIYDYFDDHYDGAPDSSHMVREMGHFIGPLEDLIKRMK